MKLAAAIGRPPGAGFSACSGRPLVAALALLVSLTTAARGDQPAAARASPWPAETVALHDGDPETHAVMQAFYAKRGHRPLWLADGQASARARELAAIFKRADEHGLRPEDYLGPARAAIEAGLPALEYTLSRTLIRYGSDLARGRVEPAALDAAFEIRAHPVDGQALLEQAASERRLEELVARLAPVGPEYGRLQAALRRLQAGQHGPPRPELPPGDTLELGVRAPAVAILRRLLELEGDLAEPAAFTPDRFDQSLATAVMRFQARHGLEPDGKVGRVTRAALAVPLEQRIRQVTLNLERLRWMNGDLGARHILVNLADFSLRLVDAGRPVFETRVVVGTPYSRTPVFSGTMTYIEVNPYWHVPQSIARNEILPAVKENPTWLVAHDMEVLSDWSETAQPLDPSTVNWRAVEAGKLRFKFRQRPGPRNALGRIKFMFPNAFNVYLHDTPARALFSRTVRSFSHGCIRVEQPEVLASILLAGTPGWDPARIDGAIAAGSRQVVRLAEPIPVHLTYLTSWVDEAGRLQFRDDIYRRDAELETALARAD